MKVYQINSVCGFGSTGRIALDLANALQANGDSCRIGYGRGTCDDPRAFRFASDLDVKLHGVLSRVTDRHGFYSKAATMRLIADIEAYAPDVIHLHNLHGYYLNISTLFGFLKEYGRPVVWTLHDCWSFTGHCAHFDYIKCDKWLTGCEKCPQKRRYPASVIADNSRRNYTDKKRLFTSILNLTLVTPSVWLSQLVKQSYLQNANIHCIPNGIDLSVFHPVASDVKTRLGIENRKIVLGVASVWDDRKGLDDFVALSGILPEDYQIVLVGLTQQQKALLPENILGILRTGSARELAELYSAADMFVNPTYEDTFPTTNLEALACGTPVITYRSGGSPEAIAHDCGHVIDKQADLSQNVQQLKDAICNLSAARRICAEQGAKYDKEQQFMQYISLYSTLFQE